MEGQVTTVTGGCGFIGSHLVDRLTQYEDTEIKVIDNLSSGRLENIQEHIGSHKVTFYNHDIFDEQELRRSLEGTNVLFHFAAHPDVRTGLDDPSTPYEQNIRNTFTLLESTRLLDIEDIIFASSSTVYGYPLVIPTPESYGLLLPVSHYGASKLACEAMISSYCNTYGHKGLIFRYANVVGSRNTRGVIWDLGQKIKTNAAELVILGDGLQSKSYVHVSDCIDAMWYVLSKRIGPLDVFNVGTMDSINVYEIADIVCHSLGISGVEYIPDSKFEGGIGWIGDVKRMQLDIQKIIDLGWRPKYTSHEAVRLACMELFGEREH